LADYAETNRAWWNAKADDYQRTNAPQIGGASWGVWQIPEDELQVLGDVDGKDVLELGCGAAQWSIELARRGARPVGLDLSERQLDHARRLMAEAQVDFPLVHSSASEVPFPDASFDIVFCDHGAMNFADPFDTVPEVSRLLRGGGLFAFSQPTPFVEVSYDLKADKFSDRLQNDYFGLRSVTDGEGVIFNLPYGEWVRLFVANRLEILDLIEPRPEEGETTTYEWPSEWCRRWPGESIWRLRKR